MLSAEASEASDGVQGDGSAVAAAAAAMAEGLSRLQELRRWHALALHCISSLLGYMLGELSGEALVAFTEAVGSHPVSLPAMLDAHDKLLDAARQVRRDRSAVRLTGTWAGFCT